MGEKVQRIGSVNGRYRIDGEAQNSRGSGEARRMICVTHGHELGSGDCWGGGG